MRGNTSPPCGTRSIASDLRTIHTDTRLYGNIGVDQSYSIVNRRIGVAVTCYSPLGMRRLAFKKRFPKLWRVCYLR